MKSKRTQIYCAVASMAVFDQLLAFGANSGFLAAVSSELILITVAACLWHEAGAARADPSHRGATVPLLLLYFAMVWALLPVVAPELAPRRVKPDALLVELIKIAALGALTMLGAHIGRTPGGLRLAISWLIFAGVAYLLFSLWLWRDAPTEVWGQLKGRHMSRFTATLLNANAAACVCAAVTLLGLTQLHYSLAAANKHRTLEDTVEIGMAGVAVLLGALAIFLTASRAAGLALCVFALIQAIATRQSRPGERLKRTLAVTLLGGAALAGAIVVRGAATLDRPFSAEDSHVRAAGYEVVWDLIKQQPLFGYGLGSYRQLNQAHLPAADADYLWDLGAAHQPVLQAVLEGGAPFAIALVGAVVWLIVVTLRNLFNRAEGQSLALGVALPAGLIFTVAQVDIALNVPATAGLAMLLMGLAWGWSLGRSARRPRRNAHVRSFQ